jgi:hypothetical protein
MAQKVLVQFVDDPDGTSSDDVSTVQFGLDGVGYEIDISAANAEQLRKIYADYVGPGRRTRGRLKVEALLVVRRPDLVRLVRSGEWTLENGFELSCRGR